LKTTIEALEQAGVRQPGKVHVGSKTALTSKETEIKVTTVGHASLEELPADYRDYLRVREHREGDKNAKEALYVRRLGRRPPANLRALPRIRGTRPPEIIANIAIGLIRSIPPIFVSHKR